MCVCICVSEDMSPYCSAHDEWLIMKLYFTCMLGTILPTMSNFGGDPVIKLIVNVYQMIKL